MSSKQLSAILIVGDIRERSQRALDSLYAQSIADSIEVIVMDLATRDMPALEISSHVQTHYHKYTQMTWGQARAEAIRYASTPIAAYIEEHCIASKEWAERLVQAHQGPWAAVGYAFKCANPGTHLARAILFAEYGLWQVPTTSGLAGILPCGNVSYKRELLLSMKDELASLLTPDFIIHERFNKQGLGLYIESKAIVAHESFRRLRDLAAASAIFCQLLASNRMQTQRWSWVKRVFYALGTPIASPVIAFARLFNSESRNRRNWGFFVTCIPVLMIKAVSSAVGESTGYLLGGRNSELEFNLWELHLTRDDA